MKTLRESILKSVKAGKYALVEEWCNNHLKHYKITPDCKVINEDDTHIFLLPISEVPEYIQFGNITSEFVIGDVINKKCHKNNFQNVLNIFAYVIVRELKNHLCLI